MDCQLPPSDPLQVRGVPLLCSGALLDFFEHAVGQDLCCALVEILAALPMGVCLYNGARQVIYINPYARNLLGITDASQPAMEIWQDIHLFEEDSAAAPNHPRPYPKENLLKTQGQHPAVDERMTVTLQYGDRRMTIELEVRPIFNRSGEMQLGLITFQDIRDRHRDETEHQHLINPCASRQTATTA
ncbi:PAS domain-containing protein [Parathermosynechococcus lividus]